MLDWITCVNTFQDVVNSGSFSKTAKRLYTTPSAITKRINWLEDHLNVPLFKRSTRQITLTEAGEALYDRTIPLLNEWKEIKDAVSTQHNEPNGILQIGVPIGFGSSYVIDMLPEFIEQHPNIKVDLKLTNCVSQLNNQQIDIYICDDLVLQNKENFHKQPIIDIHNQIYAAPTYLKKHGTPKKIEDLENHNCLFIQCSTGDTQWNFSTNKKISVTGNLRTNNTTAAINAAIAGLGILSMCEFLIKQEVQDGALVPLFPEYKIQPRTLNAFYPKQKFTPKKTSAFLKHMKMYFTESGAS